MAREPKNLGAMLESAMANYLFASFLCILLCLSTSVHKQFEPVPSSNTISFSIWSLSYLIWLKAVSPSCSHNITVCNCIFQFFSLSVDYKLFDGEDYILFTFSYLRTYGFLKLKIQYWIESQNWDPDGLGLGSD